MMRDFYALGAIIFYFACLAFLQKEGRSNFGNILASVVAALVWPAIFGIYLGQRMFVEDKKNG